MTSDQILKQGIAAYKAGRREAARQLFTQAVELDDRNEQAWIWLSGVVETDRERSVCLENVLAIDPANGLARKGLQHLNAGTPTRSSNTPSPSSVEPAVHSASPACLGEKTPGREIEHPYASALDRSPSTEPYVSGSVTPRPSSPDRPLPSDPDPKPEDAAPSTGRRNDRLVVLLSILAGVVLFGLCVGGVLAVRSPGQHGAEPERDVKAEIADFFDEHLAAHNAEDVDRYLATIHSRAPGRLGMRQTLTQMYQKYDLDTRLYDVKLVEDTGNEAKVSFVLVTRKVRGPDFRDNRIEGLMTLRRDGGEWKLYDQEVSDVKYLN